MTIVGTLTASAATSDHTGFSYEATIAIEMVDRSARSRRLRTWMMGTPSASAATVADTVPMGSMTKTAACAERSPFPTQLPHACAPTTRLRARNVSHFLPASKYASARVAWCVAGITCEGSPEEQRAYHACNTVSMQPVAAWTDSSFQVRLQRWLHLLFAIYAVRRVNDK